VANRKRRSKAEEALLEALRRLQARESGFSLFAIPPFQGLLGALQAAVGGLTGKGQTPDPGLGSRATPAAYLSTPGRPSSACLPFDLLVPHHLVQAAQGLSDKAVVLKDVGFHSLSFVAQEVSDQGRVDAGLVRPVPWPPVISPGVFRWAG
jgi:hypothetical protein